MAWILRKRSASAALAASTRCVSVMVTSVSRVSTTRSDMGTGLELDVIAAVVLGGTSIFGGVGTITGTVIGFVLIQLLKNGLAITGVKGDATIVVIGTVLILSILITNFVQRRRGGDT